MGAINIFPAPRWFPSRGPSQAPSSPPPAPVNNPINMAGNGINADGTRRHSHGLVYAGRGDHVHRMHASAAAAETASSATSPRAPTNSVGVPPTTPAPFSVFRRIRRGNLTLRSISGRQHLWPDLRPRRTEDLGGQRQCRRQRHECLDQQSPATTVTGDTADSPRQGGTGPPGTLSHGADNVIPNGHGFGNACLRHNRSRRATSPHTLNMNGHSETINGLTTGSVMQPRQYRLHRK